MMPKECPKDKSSFLFCLIYYSVQIQITDMAKTRAAQSFYEYLEQKNKGHVRDANFGLEFWQNLRDMSTGQNLRVPSIS